MCATSAAAGVVHAGPSAASDNPLPPAADGSTSAAEAGAPVTDAPQIAPPLSKNAQKKAAKRAAQEAAWAAQKAQKKEARRARQAAERAARQAEWERLSPEEQEAVRSAKGAEREARAAAARAAAELAATPAGAAAAAAPVPACAIDLDFDDLMEAREVSSLVQQLMYAYGANRRAPRPLRYHLCACRGRVAAGLAKIGGSEAWKVTRHEDGYLAAFPDREAVVYLSSESDEVLGELDGGTTYVIGGLVDHNRHKGVTQARAAAAGVRTARLPLDEHLEMAQRRVLAVNHVFEILLHKANGASWADAFAKAVPQRRGAVPREAAAEEAGSPR